MDLRSIINSDTSSSSKSSKDIRPYEASAEIPPLGHIPRSYDSPPPVHGSYQTKPVPPPLQPPLTIGSSSCQTSHSPHTYASPSSSLSGGQYPFPQPSPGYGSSQNGYHPIKPSEKHTTGLQFGRVTQSSPGPLAVQASLSPITPGSSHNYGQQYTPQHSQGSPTVLSAGGRTPDTYDGAAPLPSHPYSHRQPYHSHQTPSDTPLGPPLTPAQPATAYRREQANTYHNVARPSSSSYTTFTSDASLPSISQTPGADSRDHYPADRRDSFRGADEGQARNEREYLTQRQLERSLSVSPKTKVPIQTVLESTYDTKWSGQVTPAKRKAGRELEADNGRDQLVASPTAQNPVIGAKSSVLSHQTPVSANTPSRPTFDPIKTQEWEKDRMDVCAPAATVAAPVAQQRERSPPNGKDPVISRSPSQSGTNPQSTTPHSSSRQSPAAQPSPSSALTHSSHTSMAPQSGPSLNPQNSVSKRELPISSEATLGVSVSPQQPAKKKRRRDDPPIFARKAGQGTSSNPLVSSRRHPPMGAGPTGTSTMRNEVKDLKVSTGKASDPSNVVEDVNGQHSSIDGNAVALPRPQPVLMDDGPLGPWEPSITNVIPYEEVTRVVMDFLFMEVVERNDIGVNAAGVEPLQGAQLEIEAKLGHLVDKNTNERVRIPILTECVFNKDDPSWRTSFQSSMTESQHRTLNQFLNKAVLSSKQHPDSASAQSPSNGVVNSSKLRIPVDYVHTRERDRFYDLPSSVLPSLPLSVRPYVNARHRMRVRVTTDQKTGEKLAQIIKVRIADLDIYSPRTAFDWRISVNLEMAYDGDVSNLTEIVENGRKSERNKDRMTYKHLAYQIDLTQVTMQAEPANEATLQAPSRPEREHELEVEVSAGKIREQGLLAKTGQVSQYEDLVKGFLDNVRTLARVVHAIEGR